jgi:hypothetical protein
MIQCLYCKRELGECNQNPCKVKKGQKRESGYYWAFLKNLNGKEINDWFIVEYIKVYDVFYITGNDAVLQEENFSFIGTTNITNPNK